MRNEFVAALEEQARNDERIILIVGDLGFGVVDSFANLFPSQFYNVGVAEQSMIGIAAGLASEGFRPFVYSIGNFPSMRCLEQIRIEVAYENSDVCIVSVGAGLSYGTLGYTHHAIEDYACMSALPNMSIITPADAFEAAAFVEWHSSCNGPKYLRLGRGGEPNLHTGPVKLKEGQPLLVYEGTSGVVLSCGALTSDLVREAIEIDDKFGNSPHIFSCPFSNSFDQNTLDWIARLKCVGVADESVSRGGFGSFVRERLAGMKANTQTICLSLNEPLVKAVGSRGYLLERMGLGTSEIRNFLLEVSRRSIGESILR